MGKKGVKLDNGRNAQSSMALYWKKHHEQSKKPKKQYEPTEQQQFDQKVESGFQKWRLHKQKIMEKSFAKKQQEPQKHQEVQKNQIIQEEEEDELQIDKFKTKGIAKIPGFKSKEGLKQKLRPQQKKQVDQSDNVLKLPSHMAGLTQEDIVRILKQKKAQTELAKRKKKNQQVEDVILGEDFLESFKTPKQTEQEIQKQLEKKRQQQLRLEKEKEEHFFKSDILNEISKGNVSVIIQQKTPSEIVPEAIASPPAQKIEEEVQKPQQQRRPLFKPRVLGSNP